MACRMTARARVSALSISSRVRSPRLGLEPQPQLAERDAILLGPPDQVPQRLEHQAILARARSWLTAGSARMTPSVSGCGGWSSS
jgi:hypothetical protein